MMEHIKFQIEFLPIPFDKVEHIIVLILIKLEKRILLSFRKRFPFQANSRLQRYSHRYERLRYQS